MKRFDKEVNQCQRSALKKITEKDDVVTREMVLCVWDIKSGPTLFLTDGWYGIPAQVDKHLAALVQASKIFVGQKLRVFGAEVSLFFSKWFQVEAKRFHHTKTIAERLRAAFATP